MKFLEHVHLRHEESRNVLLEIMPVFQIRRLTGFAMLIKPTFEHADAFIHVLRLIMITDQITRPSRDALAMVSPTMMVNTQKSVNASGVTSQP